MTRARMLACALAVLAVGCEAHVLPERTATFDDVAPILATCVPCHGPDRTEAGYRVDGYLRAIGCPTGEGPAVEPPDDTAPLARALLRDDHRTLLDAQSLALLTAWIESGAPARVGAAHPAGWADPRSADFHGRALRTERWDRMLDEAAVGACARCHAGTGGAEPRYPAPGATACTSCHTEADGPRACATCHGSGGHAGPPRDGCWHPDEADTAGAHAAHLAANVDCAVCHGARTIDGLRTGEHGDGVVQIALDPTRAGARAAFDPSTRTCATTCHDRGGATPRPTWQPDAGLTCSSCHASPPADHYAGACSACHAEAADDGLSLRAGPLHANGRVDLGDGSGGCGACHGHGDDPTPSTGSHGAHAHPTITSAIACAECHVVPTTSLSPGHFDQSVGAEVTFGALAAARGSSPMRAGETCTGVACHGAGLGGATLSTPTWGARDGLASRCGACHGVPPPAPHTALNDCGSTACHGGIVGPGPSITSVGLAQHVDGRVELWP